MTKNIELEYRAEIPSRIRKRVLAALKQDGRVISTTKRLAVMYFGKTPKGILDIRVRVTNGQAEIVFKKGEFYSSKRVEIARPISKDEFIDAVRMFSLLDFDAKAAERKTVNLKLRNGVVASLVEAGEIWYLELELLSSKKDLRANEAKIKQTISGLGLQKHLITSRAKFNELCDRLSKTVDWKFQGRGSDYRKLKSLLKKHVSATI